MRFTVGDAITWDVVRPARIGVAGVDMAGFRDHGTLVDLLAVPHPAVTLALMFGDGWVGVEDGGGRPRKDGVAFGLGLGFGAVRVRGAGISCLQVRLSPVIARAVLGVSLTELESTTTVALDDLWGRDAARVRGRLDDATTWAARFALAEELVARRCASARALDPEVAWVWRRMVAGRGLVRVEELAAEVGWSRKRLWTRFRAQIGMPPKRAARLVRFDHASHSLVAGREAARVAAEGGYADQSHLHREVVSFTGVTPSALAREPFLLVDDLAWPDHAYVNRVRTTRPALL